MGTYEGATLSFTDESVLQGQFNHTVIEIVPNHKDTNTVTLHCKTELLAYSKRTNPRLVSNHSLPLLVRQMAVHSDVR